MLAGVTAYYNEFDPKAAAWLRELIKQGHIADGVVDERSIEDVRPSDLAGFTQCHFFAGIGGWSLALRQAGVPDSQPVWTGSCPCQPFSSASRGRGRRQASEKHLWPAWRRLIRDARPARVFGEQVASAGDWLDEVWDDMEADDYAFWPAVLPAGSVGADHIRERIYFLGYPNSHREPRRAEHAEAPWLPRRGGEPRGVVPAHGIPDRVACLRAFGNAVVPALAAEFIKSAEEGILW